jgi:hypothetical protein
MFTKNLFQLFQFLFQVFCFIILIYQLIEIADDYLKFPFGVKLIIKDSNDLSLPSITFCLKRDDFWQKRSFESKKFQNLTYLFSRKFL